MENEIRISSITELLGKNFYIPDYQRGYRWTRLNVTQLLSDLWEYRLNKKNANTFYCLQPLVVRQTKWLDLDEKLVEGYELIDGQQRLTTIHRILSCIFWERYNKVDLISRGYQNNLYTIYYKTRMESKAFLESNNYDKSKPDLYYMSEAYQCAKEWFYDAKRGIPDDVMDEIRRILLPFVTNDEDNSDLLPEWSTQVIWYEIKDEDQKSKDLFTRLNRGKIPLTSAELIKAKFVNSGSFADLGAEDCVKRKTQIIQIWDEIENRLNQSKFWHFISNDRPDDFINKIEYLFEIQVDKPSEEKDKLYTFIHFFNGKENSKEIWDKWISVEESFRTLSYWYNENELYHKIGYLIAAGYKISELLSLSKKHLKSDFLNKIDLLIKNSIPENWETLTYGNSNNEKITRILLLANIEMIRNAKNVASFFPFEIYKTQVNSLEHIHAQNIEGISQTKKEQWYAWLKEHTAILLRVAIDKDEARKIIEEVANLDDRLSYSEFKILSYRILNLIPYDAIGDNENVHGVSNLALLGLGENIVLSNSVFEVKREKLIELDKKGKFIPLATKRIFLKYYADSSNIQYSIWTAAEQKLYIEDISYQLATYLNLPDEN